MEEDQLDDLELNGPITMGILDRIAWDLGGDRLLDRIA